MTLPSLFDLSFGTILYLFLTFIIVMGVMQYIQVKVQQKENKKSFVALGVVALIIGIIGFINQQRLAMEAIAEAGDVSPSLVASTMSESYTYPTLGLIILGISFLFKYLNQ